MRLIKNNRLLKVGYYIFLLAIIFEVGGFVYGVRFSEIIKYHLFFDKKKESIESLYNITVRSDLKWSYHPSYFEKNNFSEKLSIHSVNKYKFSKYFFLLEKEIEKIPKIIAHENINFVYFLDELHLLGSSVYGTYDEYENIIFIKTNKNLSTNGFKKVFHHELSSILMKNYSFSIADWRGAAGGNFKYEVEKDPFYYFIFMQGNAENIPKELLYSRGLIRQYAEVGVENDFNTYAEVVFTQPKKMKKLIDQYSIIQRKYEVFKSFYLGIDKGFAPVFAKIDG